MDTRTFKRFQADGTFNAPPLMVNALTNCVVRDSVRRPICRTSRFPKSGQPTGVPLVPILLTRCRPYNITLFIMSVIIYTFQRVFWGRFVPDFIQKFQKGCKAKLDTATAIMRIFFARTRVTSVTGIGVGSIFWRVTGSVFQFGRTFLTPTSTRFHSLVTLSSEIRAALGGKSSTVTQTMPHRVIVIHSTPSQDEQTVESLTSQNFNARRYFLWVKSSGKLIVRHRFFSLTEKFKSRVVWMLKSFQPVPLMIAYSVR